MTQVVAGILERDGRILACRRRADRDHAGKWEFPGGKIEPGETPGEALARELREELGVEARIGAEIDRYEFAYPGRRPILLIFLAVPAWSGEIDGAAEFAEVRWLPAEELASLDFLAGDASFLARFGRPPNAAGDPIER